MHDKNILLVDDDDALRTVVKHELQNNGFTVHDVGDGPEALDYLPASATDVVVLDIKMPEMNGLDVLRKIKEEKLPVKVIMLTGVDELKIARESLQLGAADFMSKPFEIKNLIACIHRVLMD
jgi:DNA-binding response OmpR family regulator